MEGLTSRQHEILEFIQASQLECGVVPTLREIARHFGFRSMTASADHVRALRRKGYLAHHPRLARSHSVVPSLHQAGRRSLVSVPIYGNRSQARQIPADHGSEEIRGRACNSAKASSCLRSIFPGMGSFVPPVPWQQKHNEHVA